MSRHREPDRDEEPPSPDADAQHETPVRPAELPREDVVALRPSDLLDFDGALVWAVVASMVVHATFLFVAYSIRVPDVTLDIDVRESRGVALMSQIGFAPPQERDEEQEEEFVEVDQVPDETASDDSEEGEGDDGGGDEPPDGDEGEDERAEEDEPTEVAEARPEPDDEEGSDDDTIRVAIPETPVVENPAIVRPPAPSPEPPDVPEGSARPARGDGGAGEGSGEPDPADLPPARRYPEGTLNPVATDVGMWGPEGAASIAVVRTDRIRDSEHRDALETIFEGLGDYSDLSRNTNIDILDDVDAMLLASTDVSSSQKTFVAAVHRLDPGYLMSELRRGYPSGVNWEERGGRYFGTPGAFNTLPRRFVVPTRELLIYSPQEFLDPLLNDAPRPNGLRGEIDDVETRLEPPPDVDRILVEMGLPEGPPEPYVSGGDACADRRGIGRSRCQDRQEELRREAQRAIDAYEEQRAELLPAARAEHERRMDEYLDARRSGLRNRADREPPVRADESWIGGLADIADLAGPGDDGPAMLWTFNGFDSFGLGGLRRGTTAPRSLHAALTLEHDPVLAIRLRFDDREQAEDFRSQWPAVVEHYTFPLTAAGLLRAFRNGRWEIDHDEAIVTITVPASSMNRMATVLGMTGGLGN